MSTKQQRSMSLYLGIIGRVYVVGTGEVPVKWAQVNTTSVGDNTVVATVAGKRIRVLSIALKATLGLTLAVKSGGNTKIDAVALVANERLEFNATPGFWAETNVGEALVFNQTLVGMQGVLNYVEVN